MSPKGLKEKVRGFISSATSSLASLKSPKARVGTDKASKAALAVKKEQQRLRRILDERQAAAFYYHIDIVGTCNLRCPSCPVGNYTEATPKGLMSVETYQKILEKIAREHPGENLFIDLYNWGESVLHKQLSEIVRMTKEKGYGIGISTNLNAFPDMRRVIQASPSYIRISLSGYFNHVYQQTHKRGDINVVKANMHLLRHWIDELKSDVIIQVGFHIYRSNFEVDFWKMRQLCEDLGFIFAPTYATFMPVEKAVKAAAGEPLPGDEAILANLVIPTKKMGEILSTGAPKHRDCQFRKQRTTINFDGSVPLCCATFEKEQIIANHFLEVSREELQARKYKHNFCKTCQKYALDLGYTAANLHLQDEYAATVLGPKYKAFVDDWNISIEPMVEWKNQELSAQAAFDLAASYESKSDLSQARLLFHQLITAFPRHAEAHYRLGLLFQKEGDTPKALQLYEAALALSPEQRSYRDAISALAK